VENDFAGNDAFVEFMGVFGGFDSEKRDAEHDGAGEHVDEPFSAANLCGADGEGDGEAAGEEDGGVPRAAGDVKKSKVVDDKTALMPCGEIKMAVDGVAADEATEEENFGGEERPHAQGVGFVLLIEVVELLGDEIILRIGDGEIGVRHPGAPYRDKSMARL